jgi:MFS family permease
MTVKLAQSKLHYAWIVPGITFLTLIMTAAVRATSGVLIVPLEQEFGWSRSMISLAVSINLLLYGLIGPFAAGLLNRYGSRNVTLSSLAVLALGVALTTFIKYSWELALLWGVLVGLGCGMTAIVLGATVVHRWFRKREGLVIGVLTASSATGQLLFLPFLASLIESHGWRIAIWTVVGALLLSLIAVFCGMRSDPADIGLRAYGEDETQPAAAPRTASNPVREAFSALALGTQSFDFWLLAGSFFICGASTNGLIGTHLIPACMDHGVISGTACVLTAFGVLLIGDELR